MPPKLPDLASKPTAAELTWTCPDCGEAVPPIECEIVERIRLFKRPHCSCPAGRLKQQEAATLANYQEWQRQAEMLLDQAGLSRGRYEAARFSSWDPKRHEADALRVFDAVKDYTKIVTEGGQNWLYLHGGFGLGKTHLAVAAVREIAATRLWKPHVTVWPELCQLTQESWGGSGESEGAMWARARGAKILLLDDLDKTDTSKWAMGKLYALINNRYERQMPTIITANRSIERLRKIWKSSPDEHVRDTGGAVMSRIGGQFVASVEFKGEDQRWA